MHLHKVTLVRNKTTFTHKFVREDDARDYFERCKHGDQVLLAILHINQVLSEVFTTPLVLARIKT